MIDSLSCLTASALCTGPHTMLPWAVGGAGATVASGVLLTQALLDRDLCFCDRESLPRWLDPTLAGTWAGPAIPAEPLEPGQAQPAPQRYLPFWHPAYTAGISSMNAGLGLAALEYALVPLSTTCLAVGAVAPAALVGAGAALACYGRNRVPGN